MDQNTRETGNPVSLIEWISILALVLLVSGIAFMQRTNAEVSTATTTSNSAQTLLMGRYMLGLEALQEGLGRFAQNDMSTEMMIAQLNDQVNTSADRLAISVVVAELGGQEKGLAFLNHAESLSPELQDRADILRTIFDGQQVEASQAEQLRREMGWFGDLALALHLADDHPERVEVMKPARRTFFTAVFMVMFIGGMGLVGLVLLVLGLVSFSRKKLSFAYAGGNAHHGVAFLETFTLFLFLFVSGAMLAGLLPFALRWLGLAVPMLAMLWLPRRGVTGALFTESIGLTKGKGLLREIIAGIGGYLAGIPLVFVGFLLTFILVNLTGDQPSHPIVNQFSEGGPLTFLLLFGMACVIAPLVEETIFRGVFYHYLRGRLGIVMSALVSGLVFAAVHPQGLAAIPVLASLGAVFALIREWRGSLIAPMIAHACNNFGVLCLAIFMTA